MLNPTPTHHPSNPDLPQPRYDLLQEIVDDELERSLKEGDPEGGVSVSRITKKYMAKLNSPTFKPR